MEENKLSTQDIYRSGCLLSRMEMPATEMVESKATKWLLAQENPAIRYWALRDLEGRSPIDPEVVSWRGRIPSWKPVADLLREQHPDGY